MTLDVERDLVPRVNAGEIFLGLRLVDNVAGGTGALQAEAECLNVAIVRWIHRIGRRVERLRVLVGTVGPTDRGPLFLAMSDLDWFPTFKEGVGVSLDSQAKNEEDTKAQNQCLSAQH